MFEEQASRLQIGAVSENSMTISVDYDRIDGALATRFALRLKELIESDYGLMDQVSSPGRSNVTLQA